MRTESRADARLFGDLLRSLLNDGIAVRFQAHGRSMFPAIRDGDAVQVEPKPATKGQVALVETADGLRAHRVIGSGNAVVTRGDCCFDKDQNIAEVIGSVLAENHKPVPGQRLGSIVRRWIARWRGHF